MSARVVPTTPIAGQRPGTSGLRQKTAVFEQPHYVENFVQSILDTVGESHDLAQATLVVGGDGRFYNREAIQTILRLAAGNDVARVLVGRHGWLSTPAASAVIRRRGATGGLILSASHNPGGADGDFGIKYNIGNGGPAPAAVTDAIHRRTQHLERYRIVDGDDVDFDVLAETRLGGTRIEIMDPLADYCATLREVFDFDAIRALFAGGFRMAFDAMNAITGPYAKHIFEELLGAPTGTVLRGEPLPDFGSAHPDPNLVHAKELVQRMSRGGVVGARGVHTPADGTSTVGTNGTSTVGTDGTSTIGTAGTPAAGVTSTPGADTPGPRVAGLADAPGSGPPDLGAASDGDGDRNMILGPDCFVSPGDSLAIIAEHAQRCIPGYRDGLAGVARSMPTSTAVDRVATELGVPAYETPTGWKFFGNLMDAERCTMCGEESFGTGSNHVREKDGIWAVLCWLSIVAATRKSVPELLRGHWERFGRSFYQRHDFEALDVEAAHAVYADVRARLPRLTGTTFAGRTVKQADDFRYEDPVDGSVSEGQGLRIVLDDGSRIVLRLSGTGTEGATLRLYLEAVRHDGFDDDASSVLSPLYHAAMELLDIEARCGRAQADVVT